MFCKTITFLCILILSSIPVAAQSEITPRKSLKGGIVFSNFNSRNLETGSVPGFAIGVSLDFRISNRISVQPEVVYMEKGGMVSEPGIDTDFNLTMDYIETPLLMKYRIAVPGIVKPHVVAGPYAAFLIENNSNVELIDDEQFTPDDLVDEAKDTEWGMIFGIGTDFNFTFNTVTAEIRYSTGISSAFGKTVPESIRNSTISLLVGFHF